METRFVPTTFAEIADGVRQHLASLPSAIDSFLEDHLLASQHYRVVVAGNSAGFASIHGGKLITQFALAAPYRRHGQPIYARLRRLEEVQAAFVPTCDEFFLAHALDDYRQLAKQAYFFAAAPEPVAAPAANITLRAATAADVEDIQRESGDFFDALPHRIAAGEVCLTARDAEVVGFGIMARSAIYADPPVASIGMFTIAQHRQRGVGAATLALLRAECERRGIRPIAGCWYYNHRSKQTLERAGLYAATRLLKIDY